jgi:thiol:disulfide interchange protein DsbD
MNRQIKSLVLVFLLGFLMSPAFGQRQIKFFLTSGDNEVRRNETFLAAVRAEIEEGWHLYSMEIPPGGPIPTQITVVENDAYISGGVPIQPDPIPWFDQNFNMETSYFEDEAEFQVPVQVKESAALGTHDLSVQIRFMLCNDTSCLPPQTKTVSATLQVVAGEPRLGMIGDQATTANRSEDSAAPAGSEAKGLPAGTIAYIWFAMGMGGLALLTPCVFPMIPITVSYFTKREAATRKKAIFEAGLYSVGIIATFTLLGFALTFLFGAGGINRLAASPFVNALIALVFIIFALSLFGVIEIRLPNSWLNAVNRKSSETSGLIGILLMSLTFALTSFTCTVPFVGTVMVAALQGDFLWSLLGVTAFATVFSLPFFLLALFPSWLQSLPKSGNWMNSVKITMGFLELAAALKFISNVDLVYQWEFLTRPVFITVWVSIGLVTAVYLLGWLRFPHESPSETTGAFRVISAIFFFAVTFYLFRGLMGYSLGELDAFLPPRDYGAVQDSVSLFSSQPSGPEEVWFTNFEEALAKAKEENRNIFLDFTGYTCTNCRWMEANVFTLPEVHQLFSNFILVRLYTDGNLPEHEDNRRLEEERFNTIALPFYALISPEDETIATFPGLTRNPSEFIAFLEKGT